jgi:hypothetical protein
MPKNTSRYRGPAERAERRTKAPSRPSGRFGRVRGLLGHAAARIHRPHPRREVVILATFGLVIVVGLGSIGGAYLLYRSDHDWTRVATVNGHDISRETLRGRMAVLSLLAQERSSYIGDAYAKGYVTADQATALRSQAAAMTTLEAARQSLIDDELLRELAARDGVATPTDPDAMAEGTTEAMSDVGHRVRYVRFGLPTATAAGAATTSAAPAGSWPAATAANVDAATTRVRTELAADTPVTTIVADLHDAGWQVVGEDVAVSADGVPADASLDLDPAVAATTVEGQPGTIVGPTTDVYGRVAIGKVLSAPNVTVASRRLSVDAYTAKLDTTALQQWANGQVLKRAVTAHLIAGWSKGVSMAHFRELVIGAAPDSSGSAGPWVELSGLVVDRLSGVSPRSIAGAPAGLDLGADALAKTLKSDSATDRATLLRALVTAANKAAGSNTSSASGEIGFYTKGQLTPDIGKAAFADSVHTGDVMGPITTAAGPQLFLVESRYSGTLDERAQVALQQVRADPAPNLVTYTTQFSPTDVALATDAGWRAAPEFGPTEPVRAALFDTAIGTLSDPFVLDGKLALAVVTERKTAVPDARTIARLTLDGYDAWFAAEYAKAKITESDHPLPELEPSASPTITPPAALPSAPALDTPNVPAIPGQPVATPVKTNALGLPVLP